MGRERDLLGGGGPDLSSFVDREAGRRDGGHEPDGSEPVMRIVMSSLPWNVEHPRHRAGGNDIVRPDHVRILIPRG
jgi:hypothetical protein